MRPDGFPRKVALAAALAATLTASALASATPAHNVCVPEAVGVPSRSGPPDWMGWTGGTGLVDAALDDPRWLGASGQTFSTGGALAPLHTRMLWTATGGTKYLYLSFLVDLEGVSGAGVTTPRDLFVGFRRPSPFFNGTRNEFGYIFEFHLTGGGSGSTTNVIAPVHCATFADCAEVPGPGKDFWRVFVDHDEHDSCTVAGTTVTGPAFRALTGSFTDGAPIDWMTDTPAPGGQDAVRYWKLDSGQQATIQNRWAVQVRMKVAATDGEPLENGIPPSSTFWYQASAKLAGGDQYAAIAWWPRELTSPLCVKSAEPNTLVHPQLGDATSCMLSSASSCSPDNYSRFTTYNAGSPPPSSCDAGLFIDTPYIGSVVATASTDFTTVKPANSFKGNAVNTVLAQVVNLGPTDVSAPILARFRLANWGSAPWITPTEHGVWQDMRGAENGVCGAGASPSCAAFNIPHFVDADHDNLADNRASIKFNWTIGDSAVLGNSEFCKYGLKPPGATATDPGCAMCVCSDLGAHCDAAGDQGTRATIGSPVNPTPPCVSKRIEHECMFVELSSPGGAVQFAQQSSWNNMNFDQMSTVSREALIDARQLPKRPGQLEQDIYLIAMPRNMPGTVPGGAVDGARFVREHALVRAETVSAPYLQDLSRMDAPKIAEIARQLGRANAGAGAVLGRQLAARASDGGDKAFRERIQRLVPALQIMPDKDVKLVVGLVSLVLGQQRAADLNEDVVRTVGPAEAAGIVPTLEIYPFYQPLGQGEAYLPMTAFTVFLSHEGMMSGVNWLIDGATRVGQNIYHLRVPVGYAKKIQVRAEAIEGSAVLAPQNPRWPCAGGCASCGGLNRNCGLVATLGNTAPGMLAAVLVVRRRRKKQPAKPARPA